MTDEHLIAEALKQENERLKRENKLLKSAIKQLNFVAAVEENDNLKQTLQEIKDAVKAYMPEKQGDYRFSKSSNPSLYKLLERILDLITKAEEE